MSARLPLVIVNPASANGATGEGWPKIASELRRHFGAFECLFTEKGAGARALAEREAGAGRTLIIACGGDGTISEVADGILLSGADTELGILPSGTGGDFRRTLGIPSHARDAARALKEGRKQRIDAGRASFLNFSGEVETRHFVNVASLGMGGDVIRRVKDEPRLPTLKTGALGGRIRFALAAMRSAFAYEKPLIKIMFDDAREFNMKVTNFCIANARYFGGGMKIAPQAKLTDGLFDVVSIGDMSAAKILRSSYRVYLGTHLGLSEVGHAHARKVHAQSFNSESVEIEIDGELAGRLPATFEIVPAALRIRGLMNGQS